MLIEHNERKLGIPVQWIGRYLKSKKQEKVAIKLAYEMPENVKLLWALLLRMNSVPVYNISVQYSYDKQCCMHLR